VASGRRSPGLSGYLVRLAPFGAFTGLGTVAFVTDAYTLAALLGVGAFFTGRRLLDRESNRRKELWRRARENARELGRVAREDRIASGQMKRLVGLQEGLLESWELLPQEYRPLLDEDIFTIVGEVEGATRLARRRAALRRHLESVNRREITRRLEGLERDLSELEEGSPLRVLFESALSSRRGELASYEDILSGISMINAQLEGAESLLSNLRGELLALDTSSLSPGSLESSLVRLKERVAYFRHSLDEVTRSVETLPASGAEGLPTR
jgi:hypothetical protein